MGCFILFRMENSFVSRHFFTRLSAAVVFSLEALSRPRQIGAVAPSSRRLAQAMAHWLPSQHDAWVIELGPGTGSVTRALLDRGHAPERLLAIEKSAKMVELLHQHFPQAQTVEGDALDLELLLKQHGGQPGQVPAVISSLPLVNFDPQTADQLAQKIYDVLQPGGLYVQFTYHLLRKQAEALRRFQPHASKIIWLNLPPARVSVYRKV
jgi:phosphatidylethanolamine/phosphatidyl-N-methylethanolamine N-methyltransferase